MRRYLSFIEKIKKSSKVALNQFLEMVMRDVRMTTGANLRFIMIQTGLNRVEDLKAGKVDFEYHKIEKTDVVENWLCERTCQCQTGRVECCWNGL